MTTVMYEQNTIDEFVGRIPEASNLLRSYDVGISGENRLPLSEAAHTVSSTTDEMLAVLEYRIRRAAQRS